MRYTLKDYQADAVREALKRLVQARDNYQRYDSLSQFSLAATTGAGKTVMAAAIIEALFFGLTSSTSPLTPGPRCSGSPMTRRSTSSPGLAFRRQRVSWAPASA